MDTKIIILASGSPRRKELLEQMDILFEVKPADIDEDLGISDPAKLVEELSLLKAKFVAEAHPGRVVLGADTVVAIGRIILGKPLDENDALDMLRSLSGKTHQVFTGVSFVCAKNGEIYKKTFSECTDVVMYENEDGLLKKYIASGEPMDKAGGYGIQGAGAILIKEIHGDYYNVVGLPIARTVRELGKFFRGILY